MNSLFGFRYFGCIQLWSSITAFLIVISPLLSAYSSSVSIAPPSNPSVFLIEDVHGNLDVQEQIHCLLEQLIEHEPIGLVLFEGGSRAFDPSVYELTHGPEENQNLWNILFHEGQISALERCALDSGRHVQFLGIEDEAVYRANLCAAQQVYSQQAPAEEMLRRVDEILKKSCSHFSRYTRKILNLSSDFDGGNLNVYSYAQGVVQVARKTLGLAPANV
ncbi:MAG: hypothetical protein HY586_06225, partial [Candidatus Omnitrophica bacterium]|nr:hypothetical protein [Candidatus Omnitrophota bacterium]